MMATSRPVTTALVTMATEIQDAALGGAAAG